MRSQTAPDFLVYIQKTDDQLVCNQTEAAAQAVQSFQQGFRRQRCGQKQRVPAPDYPFTSQLLRETAEGFQTLFQRRQARLQSFRFIIIQRELKVIAETKVVDFRQVRQQRRRAVLPV